MKIKISLLLGIAFFSIFISGSALFSQEQITPEEPAPEPLVPEETAQEVLSEPQALWLWGEVVSIDLDNKQISVKYLDYETDIEKEMKINVDEKTTFENVNSIDEIKPQDTVSIDYIVTPDAQNIAKNISVEKAENLETLQEGAQAPEKKE